MKNYSKLLLSLYPRVWRERYGDEFEALLEQRGIRLFDFFDIIRGALDAHLHPQVIDAGSISERWEQFMGHRVRSSIILVFCAYIAFFLASLVFASLVNDGYFLSSIQANSDTNIIFDLLVAGSIIALLAILAGGLPITLAVIRNVRAAHRQDWLLFGAPFLALATLVIATVILNSINGGNTPQTSSVLSAILFLLAAIASTAAVCVAVARNEIEEHYYRFALIPATVATVAMILIVGLTITWGLRLQTDVPYLFYSPQSLGGTMHTTTQAEWLGIVIMMAISTAIAIGALIRALLGRMATRAV